MKWLETVRALLRFRRSPGGRVPARRDGLGRGGHPDLLRVRSCHVCGGDPRHLCYRFRELTL